MLKVTRNAEGSEFGAAFLDASFSRAGGDSARSMLDALLSDFRSFTAGVPFNDDLTVIMIRRTGK